MDIEQNLKYSLLIEIYGTLLTKKQVDVLTNFLDKNISISELANMFDTTRQAISDLVHRSLNVLEVYEEKLGLLKKFNSIKSTIDNMQNLLLAQKINKKKLKSGLNEILEVL